MKWLLSAIIVLLLVWDFFLRQANEAVKDRSWQLEQELRACIEQQ